jgi:hypothetical protein
MIDVSRYRVYSFKRGAARLANAGIWLVNTGVDLAAPLGISYLVNTDRCAQSQDESF